MASEQRQLSRFFLFVCFYTLFNYLHAHCFLTCEQGHRLSQVTKAKLMWGWGERKSSRESLGTVALVCTFGEQADCWQGAETSAWGRLPLKENPFGCAWSSGRLCQVSCGLHMTRHLGVASGHVLRAPSAPSAPVSVAFLTGKQKLLPGGCVL